MSWHRGRPFQYSAAQRSSAIRTLLFYGQSRPGASTSIEGVRWRVYEIVLQQQRRLLSLRADAELRAQNNKNNYSHPNHYNNNSHRRRAKRHHPRSATVDLINTNNSWNTSATNYNNPYDTKIRKVVGKKYGWTVEQLLEKTERLIAYSRNEDTTHSNTLIRTTTSSTTEDKSASTPAIETTTKTSQTLSRITLRTLRDRGRPLAIEFFQVLEAWMEQSMELGYNRAYSTSRSNNSSAFQDLHGMAAAQKARMLLDAMAAPSIPEPSFQPKRMSAPSGQASQSTSNWMAHFLTPGHFDVVLQAYAVCGGGVAAAEQAEYLVLLPMIRACRSHLQFGRFRFKRRPPPPEPTTKTFNIVMNCWAKSGSPNAAEHITRILQLMEEWNLECLVTKYYTGCWANERSFVSLIEAWTFSDPHKAPELALALLQEVMFVIRDQSDADVIENGSSLSVVQSRNIKTSTHKYKDVNLDVAVFNAVIYAWVRSNRGRRAATQAEDILQVLIQWSQVVRQNSLSTTGSGNYLPLLPNTRTYSMIIMAWAECESKEQTGDAALRAENILLKMIDLHHEGGRDVKPNVILFTTCIAAWSRAAVACPHAPDRAEHLWTMLCDLHRATGNTDTDFEPSTELGNAVISAWARCTSRDDSVERALKALDLLKQEGKSDLIGYNTVLDAMSKKGMAQDAKNLLSYMERERTQPDSDVPHPDRVSYNSVLAALSRSNQDRDGSAEEAEKLLRTMQSMDLENSLSNTERSIDGIRPDRMSYTCKLQLKLVLLNQTCKKMSLKRNSRYVL